MLKKLKLTDYIIILLVIVVAGLSFFLIRQKRNLSNLPVEKDVVINFEVFFRGITITDSKIPFKAGDDAFITIRNVPYTKLKIKAFDGLPRMTAIPVNNERGYAIIEDVSNPNLFDFVVMLEDKAKKTPDGYVAGGNKIKMGIPVVIEGENYKYSGTISNIVEVAPKTEQPNQSQQPKTEQKTEETKK